MSLFLCFSVPRGLSLQLLSSLCVSLFGCPGVSVSVALSGLSLDPEGHGHRDRQTFARVCVAGWLLPTGSCHAPGEGSPFLFPRVAPLSNSISLSL